MGSPDWDHYRSMLAVIDTGSLSGAARLLDLSQPTLGRHIEALEAALDAPLFTRSATGLAPTRLALTLEPHARAMATAAETLARAASGDPDTEHGVVRVTASEIVAVEVLPPILAGFRREHPMIDLELVASNRQEDLLRRDADVAVRMVRPTQDALLARRIGEVRVGLFARRDYVERFGVPESLDDLGRHSFIGYDRGQLIPSARAAVNIELTPDMFALRSDCDVAQIAALRAGFGIGALQAPLAARDPDLIPVLPGQFSFSMDVWVVMHEDLRSDRRARLLFDHLVEGMSAYLRGRA
ncbi:MAG: LysR family transcriptional regulator [Caulobacteraceae bacterium]|nr:LysR family transcriptional regulator [Caulobacteraceae bacterium]